MITKKKERKRIMKKKVLSMLSAVGAVAVSAPAFAAITLPTELPMTDFETLMGLVLGGLATMWVVRKLIKSINRS